MMTGASNYHDTIVVNIILAIGNQLRGGRCRVTTPDTAVRTRIKSLRRPDVAVTCDEPKPDSYEAGKPRLVVEVLSPSNAGIGWQRKIEEYRGREGLAYILLVESSGIGATLLTRHGDGWETADFDSLDDVIRLDEIECQLPMRHVYEGLAFEEKAGTSG
jgi:Uma2 family endonuclease